VTSATRVTGRIDSVDFVLGEAQLEALRDLASRMAPAAHARASTALTAEGRAGGIELRKAVHDAADVDTPARPLLLRTPRFPSDSARTAPHVVRLEFIVDTAGRADPETLRLASPSDTLYADAIRAVLPDWEFEPATKAGARVAQRVRQALTVPASR
jgi:outer membrane biosynthesis protein TonB